MSVIDSILIVWFALALLFAVTVDPINFLIPKGNITAADVQQLVWPPAVFRDAYVWWGETYDPLLLQNPVWLRVACAYSPFVYTPFYLAALTAFWNKQNWIRTPGLVFSGCMLGSMLPLLAEALSHVAEDKRGVFMLAYGSYVLAPLLLLLRLSGGDPFPVTSPVFKAPSAAAMAAAEQQHRVAARGADRRSVNAKRIPADVAALLR